MIKREDWDKMSPDEQWKTFVNTVAAYRPAEGNTILRIDLELSNEDISKILHNGAMKFTVQT